MRRRGRGASWFSFFLPEWSRWYEKGLNQEEKKECKKEEWEIGVESLEERVCKSFSLLATIFCPLVWVVLFYTVVTTLQVDLSLSMHTWVGEGRRWRRKWKWRQRWVVIRNISVFSGLSVHLFSWYVFLILTRFMEWNYPGSQLQDLFSLSLIRGLIILWQWLALNRR